MAIFPLAAILLSWPGLFPLDDAYITLSNARLFLSGQPDPIYHTSYMTGATSPVHLLLVAIGSLVVEPTWASLLIGLAGMALFFLALLRMVDDAKLTGWRTAAVLVVGAVSGDAIIHYLNGLETSLAMAASAWMLLWRDDRLKLPALAGVAPFLRPELGVFSLLLAVRLCLRSSPRQILAMGVIGAAAGLPWLLWVYSQTGHLVPGTIQAKLAWFHPFEVTLWQKMIVTIYWLIISYQLPLFIGLAGLMKVSRAAAAFIVLCIGSVVIIMPSIVDWNFGRYMAIYTPLLVAGVAAIAAERTRFSDILIGALALFAIGTAIEACRTYVRETGYARRVQDHARFIANLPASSVVLVHDAGQVAWAQPKAKLIDVVGLKTPAVVPIHQKLTYGECRHQKSLDAIGRKYRATHLAVINRWNWTCVAYNMRQAGWTVKPIYEDLYSIYELTPPTSARASAPTR